MRIHGMIFKMINRHYLRRVDTMNKICHKIKYKTNYVSEQLRRGIDES